MATLLYQEQENGNLKLVAEVDNDNPVLALDELLDEYPKLAGEEFVALNDGHVLRVFAEDNEIVNSRRSITISGSLVASADIADEAEEEADVDVDEEPAPAPAKRRQRRSSSKRTGAKKSAAKKSASTKKRTTAKKRSGAKKGRSTAAKKSAAKKGGNPLARKGGGGFKRNAASAE